MITKRLSLAILAQTIEDVLRYNLDRPLTGAELDESDTIYEEAVAMLARHPKLWRKFIGSPESQKKLWLERLEKVLGE